DLDRELERARRGGLAGDLAGGRVQLHTLGQRAPGHRPVIRFTVTTSGFDARGVGLPDDPVRQRLRGDHRRLRRDLDGTGVTGGTLRPWEPGPALVRTAG